MQKPSYRVRVLLFRACNRDGHFRNPRSLLKRTRAITGLDDWAHSLVVEICVSILFFTLYGHISPSQWELTMSRESPQSNSPPPGSRQHSLGSDANIRNFAPVARIMKMALPENAKIAKEAKECMQECVSEFISFITSEGTFFLAVACPIFRLTTTTFFSLREMSA